MMGTAGASARRSVLVSGPPITSMTSMTSLENGSSRSIYARLSLMMLFQYAVWGVWLPILARYLQAARSQGGLGFTPSEVALILGLAASVGAVTAPFVAGQFADRNFATERFLALLLVMGGSIKIVTAFQTSFTAWLWLSVAYSVVFMPTLSLTNSLAFAHLDKPDAAFPKIRVWGTIGWIAASWLFPLCWLLSDVELTLMPPFYTGQEVQNVTARLVDSLIASGLLSFVYAGFCFLLPHTPPRKDAVEKLAFAKAFGLLRKRSFSVLLAASLPISVIHQIYFMQTAPYFSDVLGLRDSQIGPAMTIGQFAEIAVMVATGWLLARFGFRWVIVLGCLAYTARYAVFASTFLPVPLIIASQAMHGLCYACFFAAAFIYVDRIAEDDVRNSAQTVFGIIILGVGPVLGSYVVRLLNSMFPPIEGIPDYVGLWGAAAVIGLSTAIFFGLFFRDET